MPQPVHVRQEEGVFLLFRGKMLVYVQKAGGVEYGLPKEHHRPHGREML